jgi:hypothetical protein
LWAGLVVACGGDDGVDGVDLSGRYNVQINALSGCDQDPALLAWAQGPLEITAEPTFDFGDPYTFSGSTTSAGGFVFSGVVEDWNISGSGNAEGEDPEFVLSGSVSATGPDCTITGTFLAPQIGS